SVSVLKDASATAVYGVKGANGVILITTKRGKKGKASVQLKTNQTVKLVSKLPEKYDSYDALMLRNTALERELALIPNSAWLEYLPKGIIDKYRTPANTEEWDRYPNTNWEEALFKDYALSNNTSVNVTGGTDKVAYFSSVDYLNEGDLFKDIRNNRGYNAGYGFTRINVRGNLDFQLTKSTRFSTNLFGSNGVRRVPWGSSDSDADYWKAAYLTAPDAMRPVYSDGTWGWFAPRNYDQANSVYIFATSGNEKRTQTQITSDFILNQDLSVITDGLSFKGGLSLDNRFREIERGINDLYNNAQRKWIDPETGTTVYEQPLNEDTRLDHSDGIRWSTLGGRVNVNDTYRRLYYYAQLYYDHSFNNSNVTAMGLFSREQKTIGSNFPGYREDWVFRTTYNYAGKYFVEVNGAYNGSEQFGPGYRFAFFPSFSGGWMISEENFVKNNLPFISVLKVRGSWGKIGDDRVGNARFLYDDIWSYGGNTYLGDIPAATPYDYYRISQIGNPDISWETVEKRNIGVDYNFLNGLISGAVDVFKDKRTNILLGGGQRAIPSYFGATAPPANIGEVESKGYEVELKLSKALNPELHIWLTSNMTHATNSIKFADDPELLPDYQKRAGFAINQVRSYINDGFLTSWDDVLGSTERITNNDNKLPGDYNIIDFNGDGIIDNYDRAPYQYSDIPQNTYSATFGIEWKGIGFSTQFYSVNNVTRQVTFPTFHSQSNVAYVEGTYYSVGNGGEIPVPRKMTTLGEEAAGTRYQYDGSYVRLKNAELSYSFKSSWVNRLGMSKCRLYLNGSNLWLWTKMPDDRESNFSTNGSSSAGAYPTAKRINLGVDITF
ncbi:MAG TPA: SusC/RagA family TonB-linked outer membrane protein, partial [Bacteroidales bacterium]|nr:SusC/RagA family TonB-linked outer membrane protein [Bacteroidales bacterium]